MGRAVEHDCGWATGSWGPPDPAAKNATAHPMSGSDLLQVVVDGGIAPPRRIYGSSAAAATRPPGGLAGFPSPGSSFQRVAGLLVAVRDVLVITLGRPRAQIGRRWLRRGFDAVTRQRCVMHFVFIMATEVRHSNCQLTRWLELPATRPTRRDQAKFSGPGPTQAPHRRPGRPARSCDDWPGATKTLDMQAVPSRSAKIASRTAARGRRARPRAGALHAGLLTR